MSGRAVGRAIVLMVLVGVLGAAGVAWWLGTLGVRAAEQESRAEAWAREQVLRIADDLLRPELDFDRFRYRFPADLAIEGVRLRDGDEIVVAADELRMVLTEVPRRGRPIVIERIELSGAEVRLVQDETGAFAGFSDLLASTEGRVAGDGGSSRPSDVFAIRRIAFSDAAFAYERPGEPAMRVDGLDFELLGTPETEPGWYGLDVELDRMPLFRLDLDGRLNLDEATLALDGTTLSVDLDDEGRAVLPPQVQAFLAGVQAQGRLDLRVGGTLPLNDPLALAMDLSLELAAARLAAPERGIALDVENVALEARVEDGTATVRRLVARLLGGTVSASGTVPLDPAEDAALDVAIEGVDLARAVTDPARGGLGGLRGGRVDATIGFGGRLAGIADPAELARRDLRVDLRVAEAPFARGRIDTLVESLRWRGGTGDGAFSLAALTARLGGGDLRIAGSVRPPEPATAEASADAWRTDLSLNVSKVDLARVFTARADGSNALSGVAAVEGRVTGPVVPPGAALGGSGIASLDGMNVAVMPVIDDLVVAVVGRLGGRRDGRLDTGWRLDGPSVMLEGAVLEAPVLAARGAGRIGFDGRVDLSVNAGPLEKVQNRLGRIGELFGRITDSLVTYRITGTTADTRVRVAPLGIGSGG